MALFGKRLPFAKRRREVTAVVSIQSLEEIVTRAGSDAAQKKDKGERQGCG